MMICRVQCLLNGWPKMPEHVLVRAFPRIHMTLIDLAGATFRRYGGVGFALDLLPVEVEATSAPTTTLTFCCEVGRRDMADAERLMEQLAAGLRASFSVQVRSLPPQHVGFGSKTALLLAIGTACNILRGKPLTPSDLQRLSGRGGASGVGVNTFFRGGVIVDLGHPQSPDITFCPSSAKQASGVPPVSVRLLFPEKWQVYLFMPKGRRYAGGEEVAFFQNNAPIPSDDAFRVLAAVYHGIVPAFLGEDVSLLKAAVAQVHAAGFKLRELQGQSEVVTQVLELLNKQERVAAGMSSMGPLVYAITPVEESHMMKNVVVKLQEAGMAECLGVCKGRNTGHESARDQ